MTAIWTIIKAFFGKHWVNIAVIIGSVALFFIVRAVIINAIERHDQGIVTSTEERKDKEWQSKLDAEKRQLLEDIANVKKNSKNLESKRPRNQSDTIKLLREHRLNPPV